MINFPRGRNCLEALLATMFNFCLLLTEPLRPRSFYNRLVVLVCASDRIHSRANDTCF
ncbi:hypothetical protein Hdeb2414_s0007g00231511 [Helianthus debilis subsp. tardiflorus]